MIKGVNKQIIEVSDTGNKHFEKAILFVRPEYMSETEQTIRKEAYRFLEGVGTPSHNKRMKRKSKMVKKSSLTTFLFVGILTAASIALCLILTKIF
ncbi:MAG: hypothetical protein BGN88_02355 [Clostridiales bacterium 43-6]|nr:MAG: hypothetical protein BGN88_02355 [Clostridiales bacterium 43-6]